MFRHVRAFSSLKEAVNVLEKDANYASAYTSIVRQCGIEKALSEGKRVHACIANAGYEQDEFLGSILVQMYVRCGSLEDALIVLDKACQQNVFSWNTIMVAYAHSGNLQESKCMFDRMPVRNVVSWNIMLTAYAQNGYMQEARDMFEKMAQKNVVSWNAMISAYPRNGNVHGARAVFDDAPQRNAITWNAMITAYARNGHDRNAMLLFQLMVLEGTEPSIITFISVLDACNSFAEGEIIHASFDDCGFQFDVTVGTSLVSMYGRCGRVDKAKHVFENIKYPDTIAWNAMITAYAQNGDLGDATTVFKQMPQKDVVSWSLMIGAYAQNGHGDEALGLYRSMLLDGLQPNKVTFVSALDACDSFRFLPAGKVVHAAAADCGLHSDVVVATALINMYSKCGSLEDARSIFQAMPKRDIVSWNTMISGYAQNGFLLDARDLLDKMLERDVVSWNTMIGAYAQNGYVNEARQLYYEMCLEGFQPNKITFVSILDAFANLCQDLRHCRIIHSRIADDSDVALGTALIKMYGKCGSLEEAVTAFQNILQRDMLTWNAMVVAYAQSGQLQSARKTFHNMSQHSIVSWNTMIAAYAQNGHIHDARRLFDMMPEQDVVSWTSMITAYAHIGHGKEALEVFVQMDLAGENPNKVSFISVLHACSNIAEGKIIHASIMEAGVEQDAAVGGVLIYMYGRCGSLEDARTTFNAMPRSCVISWTAMITAYAQNGHCKEALQLFRVMDLEGVQADQISILAACAGQVELEDAKAIHASIVESGFESNVMVATALVNMYSECGSLENARRLFDKTIQENVVLWTAMVTAYANNGHSDEALQLFRVMDLEGVRPDAVTFISVLSACSHAGLLQEGCQYFAYLSRDYGLAPTAGHYACMIDLLGRGGRLREAKELLESMPYKPDDVAWMTLLGASKLHGDGHQGVAAAENASMLNPERATPYLLISNMHAEASSCMEIC